MLGRDRRALSTRAASGVSSRFSGIADRDAMDVLDARLERERGMRVLPEVMMSARETSGRSSDAGGGVAPARESSLRMNAPSGVPTH